MDSEPTGTPDVYRITPCEGWVYRERLDEYHELERSADGRERVITYIYVTAPKAPGPGGG